ncbi:AcrR family transcriptional regulator [Microbacterium resistens]|uniref:AcrR family transcriptional regulator n=1 Tax=Microbacterium resistens TaxID=156977 RepID=A0ABU1SIQ1_9MICO|nr:TetR/AcrR family transcriptional regulator [Microbacterium resistens]MDR6868777.1 AcrR family transcriptional regulator [Microbacterium resistens]
MSKTGDAMGRPADEELTARILATTREMLVRDGYAGLRIDRVVREVGCGKSAVYRRYPDKAALVAAAVVDVAALGTPPDTGSVRDDLLTHALQNQSTQSESGTRTIGLVLFDPDVFPLIWESFLTQRRDIGIRILERGIARGELPEDAALDIILDTVAGLTLYHQTVKGHHLTPDDYRGVIDALIRTPPLHRLQR